LKWSGRTRALLADGDDSLVLQITSCAGIASQLGRDVEVAAGDAAVLSSCDVSGFTFQSEQASVGILLPRAVLGPFLQDAGAIFARAVPKENEALRLLKGYVAALEREPMPAGAELHRLTAAHVQDLVTLALGATREAAEIARTRGVRAARLNAARAFVTRHLDNAGLSVASVAAHLGVSPRYVHMLFEATGMSLSELVLTERLARAHRMLTSPRHAGETISVIAFAVGFADLSHFNRAFRRRYGCTPSDVRASGRIGRDGGSRNGEPA
jgi:AraC-like DNA-binding protein